MRLDRRSVSPKKRRWEQGDGALRSQLHAPTCSRPLSTQKEARSQTHVNDSNHFRLFDTECLQVVSSQSKKVCHSASAVPLCQVGTLRVSSACWSKATSAREDRVDVWPCGRGVFFCHFVDSIMVVFSSWHLRKTPASDSRDTMASVHFSVSGFFQA